MNKLYKAAKKAINDSLKVKRKERVLLVTDQPKLKIAEALAYWCKKKGAETTTYLMTETLRPISAPTKMFAEMIKWADVTMYMLDARVEEKAFRGFMVEHGSKNGRICMMPGITVNMMERLVNIDFSSMIKMTDKMVKKINNAKKVHITNPHGTDVWEKILEETENPDWDLSFQSSHIYHEKEWIHCRQEWEIHKP